MKIILHVMSMLFCLFSFSNGYAQDNETISDVIIKDANSENYFFEKVVTVNDISKEEMFTRAKEWVTTKLKTSDNNIKADEKEMTIVNGSTLTLKTNNATSAYLSFKLAISFKDGRYKFRFDNLIASYQDGIITTRPYGPKMFPKNISKKIMKESNLSLSALAHDLDNAIKSSGSNW